MWSGGRGGEGERRNVAFAHLLCQSLSLHELDSIKHFIAYKTRLMVQTCDKYVTPITLIPIYIQQDATLHSLYLETALRVSGGTTTHHQERIQLYLQHLVFVRPLLLPAAIAAGSSNDLTNIR